MILSDPKGIPRTRTEMEWAVDDDYVIPAFERNKLSVDLMLDYVDLRLEWYTPSINALKFINFIRLCIGSEPENLNSKAHYFFADALFGSEEIKPYFKVRGMDFESMCENSLVLSTREFSKSVISIYFILYMASEGVKPNFGPVNYGIYVSDNMKGNVKTTMKTIKSLYMGSDYLKSLFEYSHFTEERFTVIRKPRSESEIKTYNAAIARGLTKEEVSGRTSRQFTLNGLGCSGGRGSLRLTEELILDDGYTTIGAVKIGDKIYSPDGKTTTVTAKSEIFNIDMYELKYKDGRKLVVSANHINPVWFGKDKTKLNPLSPDLYRLFHDETRDFKMYTSLSSQVEFSKKEYALDPYLIGIMIGDWYMGRCRGVKLEGLSDDVSHYGEKLKSYDFSINKVNRISRPTSKETSSMYFRGLNDYIRDLELDGVTGSDKFIPEQYMFGDIEQRKSLLAGLLDTDGSCRVSNRGSNGSVTTDFSNISKRVAYGLANLVRGLGGYAKVSYRDRGGNRKRLYSVYIVTAFNPFSLPRKANRWKKQIKINQFIELVDIVKVDSVPSQCITVDNEDHEYFAGDYVVTHNSRDTLARPQFAIFDDMIANDRDAFSKAILESIESTIEGDVGSSLSGNDHFKVFIGTAYHLGDPICSRAIEGVALPVVFPKAEVQPKGEILNDKGEIVQHAVTKEEFVSVWEDRHPYEKQRKVYAEAERLYAMGNTKKLKTVDQEYYCRVTSEHERLISTKHIKMISMDEIKDNARHYSWILTTDYTTTGSKSSDDSASFLFAIDHEENRYLVDMRLRKMHLNEQYQNTMDMIENCLSWGAMNVSIGIEIDGQQSLHIIAIERFFEKQNKHGILNIASQKERDGKKVTWSGIRSKGNGDKLWRLKVEANNYHMGKVFFNSELDTPENLDYGTLMRELKNTTNTEIKSTDNGLDALSQLSLIDYDVPTMSAKEAMLISITEDENSYNEELTNYDTDIVY